MSSMRHRASTSSSYTELAPDIHHKGVKTAEQVCRTIAVVRKVLTSRRDDMEPGDSIAEFFSQLGRRGHEQLLAKVTGSVRFELVDGGRTDEWRVALTKGDITVSHEAGPADCTIRVDRRFFERLCRGEENAIAATLRGALVCRGDVELLFAIQRIFPGPQHDRHAVSGSERAR
jgi:SCP-2 sterol transfer family